MVSASFLFHIFWCEPSEMNRSTSTGGMEGKSGATGTAGVETINPLQLFGDGSDSTGEHNTASNAEALSPPQSAAEQTTTTIELALLRASDLPSDAAQNLQEGEPAAVSPELRRGTKRLRRSIVAVGRTAQPGWCVGVTMYGLFLLVAVFIVEATLFAFHCTTLTNWMVDETDARGWCGVTPQIAVLAGILLVPAMLQALASIAALTCCWRCAVHRERRKAGQTPWRRVSEAKSTFRAVWRCLNYLRKPTSAHYVQLMFVFEVKEFIFQSLALELMSRSGIGREALTLYTTVVLLNGLTPLGMRWIVHRINRIEDPVRRRVEASKWLARLCLFDATCDLLYSFFGLAHLMGRYFGMFVLEADVYAAELETLKRYSGNVPQTLIDLKAYVP